jgi:hypothetical protein
MARFANSIAQLRVYTILKMCFYRKRLPRKEIQPFFDPRRFAVVEAVL